MDTPDLKPDERSFASALKHKGEEQALVLAHAKGSEVAIMLELAQRHDIPVLQDFALSHALSQIAPGSLIPDTVCQSVGIFLDFLFKEESSFPEKDP